MCLIIKMNKDQKPNLELFKDAWLSNNDGYGILVKQDGVIKEFKGLSFKQFLSDYKQHAFKQECLIHFRMKTHGAINHENLHPFKIHDDIYMMHNGIIDISSDAKQDKEKSDTRLFVENVLKPLFKNMDNPCAFLRSNSFKLLMSSFVGNSNRLAFMDKHGIYIPNNLGNWSKTTCGIKVSNTYAFNHNNPDSYVSYWNGFNSTRPYGINRYQSTYSKNVYEVDDYKVNESDADLYEDYYDNISYEDLAYDFTLVEQICKNDRTRAAELLYEISGQLDDTINNLIHGV